MFNYLKFCCLRERINIKQRFTWVNHRLQPTNTLLINLSIIALLHSRLLFARPVLENQLIKWFRSMHIVWLLDSFDNRVNSSWTLHIFPRKTFNVKNGLFPNWLKHNFRFGFASFMCNIIVNNNVFFTFI